MSSRHSFMYEDESIKLHTSLHITYGSSDRAEQFKLDLPIDQVFIKCNVSRYEPVVKECFKRVLRFWSVEIKIHLFDKENEELKNLTAEKNLKNEMFNFSKNIAGMPISHTFGNNNNPPSRKINPKDDNFVLLTIIKSVNVLLLKSGLPIPFLPVPIFSTDPSQKWYLFLRNDNYNVFFAYGRGIKIDKGIVSQAKKFVESVRSEIEKVASE